MFQWECLGCRRLLSQSVHCRYRCSQGRCPRKESLQERQWVPGSQAEHMHSRCRPRRLSGREAAWLWLQRLGSTSCAQTTLVTPPLAGFWTRVRCHGSLKPAHMLLGETKNASVTSTGEPAKARGASYACWTPWTIGPSRHYCSSRLMAARYTTWLQCWQTAVRHLLLTGLLCCRLAVINSNRNLIS